MVLLNMFMNSNCACHTLYAYQHKYETSPKDDNTLRMPLLVQYVCIIRNNPYSIIYFCRKDSYKVNLKSNTIVQSASQKVRFTEDDNTRKQVCFLSIFIISLWYT